MSNAFRNALVYTLLTFLLMPLKSFSFWWEKPLQYHYDNPKIESEKKRKIKKDVKEAKKDIKNAKKFKRNILRNLENSAPLTVEEYNQKAQDVKRSELKIPEPQFAKDDKIINLPDPHERIVKYNLPPGTRELDLKKLRTERRVNSIGVLSPDMTKLVYSSAYYYPLERQVSSELYLIKADDSASLQEKIKKAHELNKEPKPLLSTGMDSIKTDALRTMIVLDWSADSKKIAVKEKIGSSFEGIWQTNLWVYDFNTQNYKKLNEIREAVKYWWKTNENLDLNDYMWDIFPVGWDGVNPDRIIVYAFAYTKETPKFLGTWSIDYKGERSELMSLTSTNFLITTNGLMLKTVLDE